MHSIFREVKLLLGGSIGKAEGNSTFWSNGMLASYVLWNWIYNAIWNWIVWGCWYQTLGYLFVCCYSCWRILSFWSVLFCCSVLSIVCIFWFNNIWYCCCMLVRGYWYQLMFVYVAACLLTVSSRVWFGLISEVAFSGCRLGRISGFYLVSLY